MIRKIVFVFSKYFEKKDWNIFNCPYFLEKGYEIEILSLVQIHYKGKAKKPLNIFNDHEVKYFDKIYKFREEIKKKKRKETLFIVYPSLGENPGTGYIIRRIIKQLGFQYCDYFYPPYLLEEYKGRQFPNTWMGIMKYYMKHWENKRDIKNLLFSIIYPPKLIFITAKENLWMLANKYDTLNKKKLLYINTPDYDEFISKNSDEDLTILREEGLEEDKYIVFLDEAFTHHSDITNLGLPGLVTENIYQQEIAKFFGFVENYTGMKVVIALHPKAEYINSSIFGNRKMIRGKSRILIKYCSLVIMNCSTALSYVMLYNKKVVVYITEQLKRNQLYRQMTFTEGKYLGCKIVNISKKIPDDLFQNYVKSIEKSKREDYIDRFVCSRKQKEKLSAQLIDDCLKKI